MTYSNYGSSLKGELFSFVHEVCETEMGVSMGRERVLQWAANPKIFSGYLALSHIRLKFPPSSRNNIFMVDEFELVLDDGDMSLFVDRTRPGDLNGDLWVEDVLTQAASIYNAHSHEECMRLYNVEPVGTPLVGLRDLTGEVIHQ
jgi:hypothetical protein